jgi:pheromone shutdown protein TraB
MPEFCNCGAQLPPDARFCHKCGKPQRDSELETVPPVVVIAAALPAQTPAPMPLTFANPVAVRIGFFVALIAAFLTLIPFVNYAFILWLLAAGFFSVVFYKRRTGQRLSVRSGARMGWITGVLSFGILTILLTITLFAVTRMGGFGAMREQMRSIQMSPADIDEAIATLQNPMGIVRSLAFMFVVMTVAPMAGGALGAKLLNREKP